MPEIFQRFDLNLEQLTKKISRLSKEEKEKLNFPKAADKLRKGLSRRGYIVLESETRHGGISETIIIGGEYGTGHKKDFYGIAEKLGLEFTSGDFYVKQGSDKLRNKPVLLETEAKQIVENRIDTIEKIFGYYGDKSKQTSDYEAGREMMRKEFYSEMKKSFKIVKDVPTSLQ